MAMNYEELDEKTREYILAEYEREQAGGNPYRSKAFSDTGLSVFPDLMRDAIKSGNEITLRNAINQDQLWVGVEEYTRNGITRTRRRNIQQSAERLALTEFSTWYVTGLAKRLLEEGVENCQVYRGEQPKWEPNECANHEGRVVSVKEIYDSHRSRYWPEPGDPTRFSIPFDPNCHHAIRRI